MTLAMDTVYNFDLIRRHTPVGSTGDIYSGGKLLDVLKAVKHPTPHVQNPAEKIAHCFEALRTGVLIDRVCLSVSPRLSRKLTILSSWNRTETLNSDLVEGYSCFVSPGSSLLTNSRLVGNRARIRKYDDLNVILRSFIDTHQPVQKTIGKLAQAGIRSGLTIALESSEWGTAFLFLNSKAQGAFEDFPETYTFSMRTLQELVRSVTAPTGICPLTFDKDLIDVVDKSYVPNTLSTMHLEAAIVIALADRFRFRGKVSIKGPEDNAVLYPAHTALLMIMLAIESNRAWLASQELCVTIETDFDTRKVSLQFNAGKVSKSICSEHASALKWIARNLDFEIDITVSGFRVSTEFQPASRLEASCGYSVY